jgi:hypothetical protein
LSVEVVKESRHSGALACGRAGLDIDGANLRAGLGLRFFIFTIGARGTGMVRRGHPRGTLNRGA